MSKSISGMRDPYEDQLAAARYRAERDQARQEVKELRDVMESMNPRIMPEGMEWDGSVLRIRTAENVDYDGETLFVLIGGRTRMFNGMNGLEILNSWPRYESGEPVPIGGEFMGKDGKIYTAKQIQFIGKCFSLYDFCDRKPQFNGFYGERVKRPAVLAADGEPLEVGQMVYHIESGDEFTVTGVDAKSGDANLRWGYDFEMKTGSCAAELLTHQRPVLDAYGVPINVGDTVYGTVEGGPFIVTEVSDKGSVFVDAFPDTGMHGSMFTHTKPEPIDTWQRIEEDSTLSPEVYCHRNGIDISQKDGTEIFLADTVGPMARDLVRRCKALAERERGE